MNDLAVVVPASLNEKQGGKPVRVLGIDLGTTNSTVAEVLIGSAPGVAQSWRALEVVQETEEGEYVHVLVPSVVAFRSGKTLVGEGAKRLRTRSADFKLEQYRDIFWECKNDMGIRRSYHRAPEGFRSAPQIASHVLRFLAVGATLPTEQKPDRIVVTVPASFGAAQREDTLQACREAGIDVQPGDLLDEPLAAFLDHAVRKGFGDIGAPGEVKRLLVFDFGGGTCDIAIFELTIPDRGRALKAATLAVSRYHRLGGGDIDAAVLHDVLVPQLAAQNGLSPFDFTFEDKSKCIAPAFLGLAEQLKTGLCSEIWRLDGLERYEGADKTKVFKKQPGTHTCRLGDGRVLSLKEPLLTAEVFEKLLEPFFDQDILYHRETEYRSTCSIFAPITDALDRSQLKAEQIDACLLIGGSSLIPSVVSSVNIYFPKAHILFERDATTLQVAVAKGAALHAAALAIEGRGVITPVTADSISIETTSGPVEIVPKGSALPYPRGGEWAEDKTLVVPTTSVSGLALRVDLVDGKGRGLMSESCRLPGLLNHGEPIRLLYRMDENQVLCLKVGLVNRPERGEHELSRENPLTSVVSGNKKREELLEIEEKLRAGGLPASETERLTERAAVLYGDLRQNEKALALWRRLLQRKSGPDAFILNRMGLLAGDLGDLDRQEKFYREAARASSWNGPLFNLALAKKKRGLFPEAMEILGEAFQREVSAADYVLRAQLHIALGDPEASKRDIAEALRLFEPAVQLQDWELFWFGEAARMAGDQKRVREAEEERGRRRRGEAAIVEAEGDLPAIAADLAKVN